MRAVLKALARRRESLVARSAAQRGDVHETLRGVRSAITEPLALGLAAALALAGTAPRLRTWFVRAWVIGALVKRLLR